MNAFTESVEYVATLEIFPTEQQNEENCFEENRSFYGCENAIKTYIIWSMDSGTNLRKSYEFYVNRDCIGLNKVAIYNVCKFFMVQNLKHLMDCLLHLFSSY